MRKRAWNEFSKFIRRRDPQCVTCGAKTTQAGHFIHGVTDLPVNFDERNINGQCAHCNLYLSGNLIKYTLYMLNKYGQETIDELYELKNASKRLDYQALGIKDYEALYLKYKALNELAE